MAEFKEDFDEGYKKCPFNELHRVAPRRYVNHLNKCPDRNRDDLSTCPYNESHRILKRDWDRHMQECEDKRQFVRNIVEERLQKNKTGKSFVYSTLDEKLRPEFRIERGEDEEKVPMVIPGIQVQMSVDEIVEKVERDQSTPSPYVVQRLQKSQRKYLHHCLVEKAKAKSESLSRSSIASAQSQEEMSSISPTPSLFENTIFVIKNSQYSQTDSSLSAKSSITSNESLVSQEIQTSLSNLSLNSTEITIADRSTPISNHSSVSKPRWSRLGRGKFNNPIQ